MEASATPHALNVKRNTLITFCITNIYRTILKTVIKLFLIVINQIWCYLTITGDLDQIVQFRSLNSINNCMICDYINTNILLLFIIISILLLAPRGVQDNNLTKMENK